MAALTQVPESELQANVKIMRAKRDYVLQRLSQDLPKVRLQVPPKGAFYVLPDVSYYTDDEDAEFCLRLLDQQQLALVPGSSFGAPGTVRISYATSLEELKVAMDKLQAFVQGMETETKKVGTEAVAVAVGDE